MQIEHVENNSSKNPHNDDITKEYAELFELKQDLAILVDELTKQKSLPATPHTSSFSIVKPKADMTTGHPQEDLLIAEKNDSFSVYVDIFASEERAKQQKQKINNKHPYIFEKLQYSIARHPVNNNFYTIELFNIANVEIANALCLHLINNNHNCQIAKRNNNKILL